MAQVWRTFGAPLAHQFPMARFRSGIMWFTAGWFSAPLAHLWRTFGAPLAHLWRTFGAPLAQLRLRLRRFATLRRRRRQLAPLAALQTLPVGAATADRARRVSCVDTPVWARDFIFTCVSHVPERRCCQPQGSRAVGKNGCSSVPKLTLPMHTSVHIRVRRQPEHGNLEGSSRIGTMLTTFSTSHAPRPHGHTIL